MVQIRNNSARAYTFFYGDPKTIKDGQTDEVVKVLPGAGKDAITAVDDAIYEKIKNLKSFKDRIGSRELEVVAEKKKGKGSKGE